MTANLILGSALLGSYFVVLIVFLDPYWKYRLARRDYINGYITKEKLRHEVLISILYIFWPLFVPMYMLYYGVLLIWKLTRYLVWLMLG